MSKAGLYAQGTDCSIPRAPTATVLDAMLVLSASDDNRISLIELLENNPLSQVYVDGVKLVRQFRSVKRAGGVEEFALAKLRRVEDFLVEFQSAATVDECECESD